MLGSLEGTDKLLIDNLNVVNFLKATGKSVSFIPRDCPFLWQRVRRMLLRIEDWEVEWIPSHGKKPNWSAIEPANTKEYRQLNEAADAECTLALEPFVEGIKEWEKE